MLRPNEIGGAKALLLYISARGVAAVDD